MRIPKSVNKLDLKTFIKLRDIEASDLESFDKGQAVLSLVTGLSDSQIEELPLWKLDHYFKQVAVLRNSKPNLRVKRFILMGWKLYTTTKNEKHLNTNQFVTTDHYATDSVANMAKIAAVLYKRVTFFGLKFTQYSFEELTSHFEKKRIGSYYGAVFFYSNKLKASRANLDFYNRRAKETIRIHLEEIKNTVGIPLSMVSQAETLLKKMN
jgi:hypothetical protein